MRRSCSLTWQPSMLVPGGQQAHVSICFSFESLFKLEENFCIYLNRVKFAFTEGGFL